MMTLKYVNILAVLLVCQQAFVELAVEECSGEAEYSILGMMLKDDTSSRRSRERHSVMCACGNVIVTSDAKVLITSFPRKPVN